MDCRYFVAIRYHVVVIRHYVVAIRCYFVPICRDFAAIRNISCCFAAIPQYLVVMKLFTTIIT